MTAGASGACALVALVAFIALVAFPALALAQNRPADLCKANETQAECHARLKCNSDEDLEDCKKRLQKGSAAGQQRNTNNQGQGGDREPDDRPDDRDGGRDREPDDRSGGREPDDRGRDRHADDRGQGRRGRDRGTRQSRHRSRSRSGGDRSFAANKTFGLGLELGEPSGLSGKYFLSDNGALDFGLGAIYSHYYYGDGVHLYGDFLWHPISLTHAEAFELPLYIGGGLRFWSFEYCDPQICYDGSAVGIRVPIGISFDFNNAPLDIFIQLVPVIDFLNGDYYDRYRDRTHIGIDLSVGIRYWFK